MGSKMARAMLQPPIMGHFPFIRRTTPKESTNKSKIHEVGSHLMRPVQLRLGLIRTFPKPLAVFEPETGSPRQTTGSTLSHFSIDPCTVPW